MTVESGHEAVAQLPDGEAVPVPDGFHAANKEKVERWATTAVPFEIGAPSGFPASPGRHFKKLASVRGPIFPAAARARVRKPKSAVGKSPDSTLQSTKTATARAAALILGQSTGEDAEFPEPQHNSEILWNGRNGEKGHKVGGT